MGGLEVEPEDHRFEHDALLSHHERRAEAASAARSASGLARSAAARVIQLLAVKPAFGGALIEVGYVAAGLDDRVGVSIEDPDAALLQANRLLSPTFSSSASCAIGVVEAWARYLTAVRSPRSGVPRTGVDETPRARLFDPGDMNGRFRWAGRNHPGLAGTIHDPGRPCRIVSLQQMT